MTSIWQVLLIGVGALLGGLVGFPVLWLYKLIFKKEPSLTIMEIALWGGAFIGAPAGFLIVYNWVVT